MKCCYFSTAIEYSQLKMRERRGKIATNNKRQVESLGNGSGAVTVPFVIIKLIAYPPAEEEVCKETSLHYIAHGAIVKCA